MNPRVLLVMLTYVQLSYAANYKLNDEEYELMPPIIHLDPFEKCLRDPGGRYCTAHVNFVAEGISPLLKQMQEFSKHTAKHFNHTRSIYGVCMQHNCRNFKDEYTVGQGNSLEACLNDSLWKMYNLKVRVEEDISCIEHNEKGPNVGAVDIAVAYIVLGLVICNVVGSLVDNFSTKQDHGQAVQFLLCFSVPRNWKKLNVSPQENSTVYSLKGLYGIRAISMTLVIIVHGVLPSMILCENPKYLEDQYDVLFNHIFLNGTLIMQTFLFLSAFLLVYNFLIYAEKNEISWRMLPMAILLRWLRLTPPYALVLAVIATWVRYFSTGPIWNMIVVQEAVDCRRYWWQHLLYINNYEDNSLCMPHAWYVAADTQLFCLGVTILVLCQSPRCRKIVMYILFVIGLIIPPLHTYYQDLDGTLLLSPSASVTLFTNDKTFNNVYKRGHTNIPSYIMGMAFGYLVYNLQKNNFDVSKYRRWRPIYWLLLVIGVSMLLFCKMFYEGPRVALIYRVLTSLFMKPIFGLLVALVLTGMIFKIENLYRGILEWQGWTPLARVSYSAYLLHITVIRISTGVQTYPIRVSYQRVVEAGLFNLLITYTVATLFWLIVEAPLAQLVKNCFSSKVNPRSSGENVQKKEVGSEKVHKSDQTPAEHQTKQKPKSK